MVKTTKKYWKSLKLRDNKIVSDYDQSEWTVGKYRANPYPVVKECEGLNCCWHIGDAMGFVRCEVLAEVTIRGKTITGDDKITAQEMRIVRAWKWTKMDSVALAIFAAELVIGYYEKKYPNDKRPREAIEAAKKWLADPTEENASAYAAASASASAAYAASASASAASAAYAAASASKEDREKAREEMKTKIDEWIVVRLKTMEQIL